MASSHSDRKFTGQGFRPLVLTQVLLLAVAALLMHLPARADLADTVAAAKPAVFPFGVHDPLASPRFGFRGTAFVVGDGRTVVTNMHVLPDDYAVRKLVIQVGQDPSSANPVTLRELTVVATDPDHDLVVLSFAGEPLPTLKLAEADTAREGQAVAFLGFPIGGVLGFSTVTHRAIVSSIAPIVLPRANARQLNAAAVNRLRQGAFDILQLDGTAYPGNSGGPLLDADTGRVVGVINMVLVKGSRETGLSNPTGITYAIPVRWLRELLTRR